MEVYFHCKTPKFQCFKLISIHLIEYKLFGGVDPIERGKIHIKKISHKPLEKPYNAIHNTLLGFQICEEPHKYENLIMGYVLH